MNHSGPHGLRVAIRCDAVANRGTGHLVRQTALIQELVSRGHEAQLYGECDVPWARMQAEAVGVEFIEPEADFVAQIARADADIVMIDGYEFPSGLGASLQTAGVPVATMVDGAFGRAQTAGLYVDQNLGSPDPGQPGWLVGPQYVLLRDVVRDRRTSQRPLNDRPRVLVVFGGSDPFAGAPVAVQLLALTGEPMSIVAIAPNRDRRKELEAVELAAGQTLEVLDAQDDLPGLAVECDFAVSAAGTSVWEFACMGVPTGLVCVVDNQVTGYEAATESLAVGVGHLDGLKTDEAARLAAVDTLRKLAVDKEHRANLSAFGKQLVDGDGRARVVDAMERLVVMQ